MISAAATLRSNPESGYADQLRLCLSLSGRAFRAGEMRRQELSGSVQRRGPFVEDRVIGLEDVGHSRGDVERDLDVGGGGPLREADGVVEEDLVRSGLDDQRRQAGQVGEDRADEAKRGVLSRRVVGDPGLEGLPAEQRVDARALVSMLAPARVRSAYGDMTKAAAGRGSP